MRARLCFCFPPVTTKCPLAPLLRSSPLYLRLWSGLFETHRPSSLASFNKQQSLVIVLIFFNPTRGDIIIRATCCRERINWLNMCQLREDLGDSLFRAWKDSDMTSSNVNLCKMKKNFNYSVDLIVLSCLKFWKHVLQPRLIQSYSLKSVVKIVLKF